MIKEHIRASIGSALQSLIGQGRLTPEAREAISSMGITRTKDKSFGDFAANIALILAKSQGKSPRDIGMMLKDTLMADTDTFTNIDVAGPGFLNVTLADKALSKIISHIAKRGTNYGRHAARPQKVLLEFVSANPTGGLHLGHARGAFMGDALARLLEAAGYQVTREFYVNDTGNQIDTLARTIHKRYRELFGQTVTIEQGEYPGEYVKDIALALKNLHGDKWLDKPEEAWLLPVAQFGVDYNLSIIKRSLLRVDIHMDAWFSEQKLHQGGDLARLIAIYQERGMVYEATAALGNEDKVRRDESKASQYTHMQEGGLFLKTKQYGDDEDRIIQRKDGRFVYLTADLAYHHDKFARGFDIIIDVLGGDHAGHVGRIKAGMKALGHDLDKLKFVVVQIVRLLKDGQEVRFSKRAGQVVGLDDLIDEVGKDVARFVFLMRGANAQFDLDLDAVTASSSDNPVFYVQYGHARMATILAKAKAEQGIVVVAQDFDLDLQTMLTLPEERELLLRISELDEVVAEAAQVLEPHRLIYFCHDLIKTFHAYFTKYRHSEKMISSDTKKTLARLSLVFAVKQSIFNALSFLGISAPDHMEMNAVSDLSGN
jgi:arginyl-tRNA synthetase